MLRRIEQKGWKNQNKNKYTPSILNTVFEIQCHSIGTESVYLYVLGCFINECEDIKRY